MRFATMAGEGTIEALVERLYRIEGKGAAATARRAGKALRDLNPQLKDVAAVAEGSAILVPDVEGAAAAGADVPPARIAADAARAEVEAALEASLGQLEQAIAAERDDARRSVELLGSRKLKAAAKSIPDGTEQRESSLAGARERLEDMDALERYCRTLARGGGGAG
jgi:hypothetical protein